MWPEPSLARQRRAGVSHTHAPVYPWCYMHILRVWRPQPRSRRKQATLRAKDTVRHTRPFAKLVTKTHLPGALRGSFCCAWHLLRNGSDTGIATPELGARGCLIRAPRGAADTYT
jgi:hypothetical protein